MLDWLGGWYGRLTCWCRHNDSALTDYSVALFTTLTRNLPTLDCVFTTLTGISFTEFTTLTRVPLDTGTLTNCAAFTVGSCLVTDLAANTGFTSLQNPKFYADLTDFLSFWWAITVFLQVVASFPAFLSGFIVGLFWHVLVRLSLGSGVALIEACYHVATL